VLAVKWINIAEIPLRGSVELMWFNENSVLCGLAHNISLVVQLCGLGSCCAASEHLASKKR
jgi:hypothetical protein